MHTLYCSRSNSSTAPGPSTDPESNCSPRATRIRSSSPGTCSGNSILSTVLSSNTQTYIVLASCLQAKLTFRNHVESLATPPKQSGSGEFPSRNSACAVEGHHVVFPSLCPHRIRNNVCTVSDVGSFFDGEMTDGRVGFHLSDSKLNKELQWELIRPFSSGSGITFTRVRFYSLCHYFV